jgi:GNAT superfamily N-acetyltransferase
MKIKKYSNETLKEGRKICNKNHLYVPTWSFSLWLKKDYVFNLRAIYIIFSEEKAIGSCLVLNDDYDVNVGIFVKPKYRNRGFGKKLLRFVARNNKDRKLRYAMGMIGSLEFFDKAKENLDNLQNIDYDEFIYY